MGTTTTNKHWGMVIEDWIVFGLHTQCVSIACELCVHVGLHSMDRWGSDQLDKCKRQDARSSYDY